MNIRPIRLLEESVINQIKAGEVIDSPAGIIKELIENAIDAGADEIDIRLFENGIDQINIKDNGHGIRFEDLPLAFSRHATSKLNTFQDLYKMHTLGFRGEALASLSSVSEIKCITTTSKESSQFHIKGELVLGHELLSNKLSSTGTQLIIKNLFYNTPVRMKFLNSKSKQKNEILKILYAYMISNPKISFSLKFDNKEKLSFPTKNIQDRFLSICKLAKNESEVLEHEYEQINMKLIIGKVEKSRPRQMIIVNGRFILDDKIRNTINYTFLNAHKSKNIDWALILDLPPNHMDINVHPKKTTLLLYQQSTLLSMISSALKSYFSSISKHEVSTEIEFNNTQMTKEVNLYSPTQSTLFSDKTNNENQKSHLHTFDQTLGYQVKFSWPNNQLFLLQKDEEVFILKKIELTSFIIKSLNEVNERIPLLVSEPIHEKISHETAKLLKIEIEYLDDDTLIKSIPEVLSFFDFKSLLSSLDLNPNLEQSLNDLTIQSHEIQYFLNNFSDKVSLISLKSNFTDNLLNIK